MGEKLRGCFCCSYDCGAVAIGAAGLSVSGMWTYPENLVMFPKSLEGGGAGLSVGSM